MTHIHKVYDESGNLLVTNRFGDGDDLDWRQLDRDLQAKKDARFTRFSSEAKEIIRRMTPYQAWAANLMPFLECRYCGRRRSPDDQAMVCAGCGAPL